LVARDRRLARVNPRRRGATRTRCCASFIRALRRGRRAGRASKGVSSSTATCMLATAAKPPSCWRCRDLRVSRARERSAVCWLRWSVFAKVRRHRAKRHGGANSGEP
jgi:hypothetical protein